jgi:hypothetical protein
MEEGHATTNAMEWGSVAQRAVKQRAAVQREVSRLLDALAPERPPARRDEPSPSVRLHRSPGRCILQGAARAVSVSWFPGRPDGESLGEMVVTTWRGTVSLPGGAQRAAGRAEELETVLLVPVEEAGAWHWRPQSGDKAFDTPALASYCQELLEQ